MSEDQFVRTHGGGCCVQGRKGKEGDGGMDPLTSSFPECDSTFSQSIMNIFLCCIVPPNNLALYLLPLRLCTFSLFFFVSSPYPTLFLLPIQSCIFSLSHILTFSFSNIVSSPYPTLYLASIRQYNSLSSI